MLHVLVYEGKGLPGSGAVEFTLRFRVANDRLLNVFDIDNVRRILRVRRSDCVRRVELRSRLYLTNVPALLVQRRLHWFGHATRRPDYELIKDLLLSPCLARNAGELEVSPACPG